MKNNSLTFVRKNIIINLIIVSLVLYSVLISIILARFNISIPAYLVVYIFVSFSLILIAGASIKTHSINIKVSQTRILINLLLIYFLSTIKYSTSTIAANNKFLNIFYSIYVALILIDLIFIFVKKSDFDLPSLEIKFIKTSKILLITLFLFYFLGFKMEYSDSSGRISMVGLENPIWLARYVCLLLFCTFYEIIKLKKISIYNSIYILVAIFLVYKTGSRGPLVSLIICTIIMYLKNNSVSKSIVYTISFLITVFCLISIFGGRFTGDDNYSIISRINLLDKVINGSTNFIWGNGIGSFGIGTFGDDLYFYPHNIILEYYYESGLIGVMVLFLILYLFYRNFTNHIINYVTLFFLFNSLFSGDIPGNNFFYISLYISSFISKKYINTKSLQNQF